MEIYKTLTSPLHHQPVVLTIGNFDGVHLGHVSLFSEVIRRAKSLGGYSAVLSFSNHPSQVFAPEAPFSFITHPINHKPFLIEKFGIDFLYLLPFTKEFAKQCPEDFLGELIKTIHLKELILGYDAKFGCGKTGTPETVQVLGKELGITVQYLPAVTYDGEAISSSLIRKAIISGNLDRAAKLLGRPFSIRSTVVKGAGKGKTLGFPTANLNVDHLVLPPYGVYACKADVDGKTFAGVVNLGFAPTLRAEKKLQLEVHFFENPGELYGKTIELYLLNFLRGEKKFSSPEELKHQIKKDVEKAKKAILPTYS